MATINVDESTKQDLKKFCARHGISQGEFVKLALGYFAKSGINPAEPPESVKEELNKIEKRLSQVIAFQKTFERDNLIPLLKAVTETDINLRQHSKSLALLPSIKETAQDAQVYASATNEYFKMFDSKFSTRINEISAVRKLQLDMQEIAEKRHAETTTYLTAIVKHGAGVGGLNTKSIYDNYAKNAK